MEKNCIYKISNINTDKVYIGSTTNYDKRVKCHISELKLGKHHNNELQIDWNIYGEASFEFNILEYVTDIVVLSEREKYYIDQYRDVYNKSNPLYEYDVIKSREKLTHKKSDKNDNKKIRLCIKLLNEQLSGEFQRMKDAVKSKHILDKDKVDKYIMNKFNNDKSFTNSIIIRSLEKIYKELKFVVTDCQRYRNQLKSIGYEYNIKGKMIISKRLQAELFMSKYRKDEFESLRKEGKLKHFK